MDVLMELSRVIINDHSPEQIIYLRERGGERTFPIRIGMMEAHAIDRRLKKIPSPRPMTHDLLESVLGALGAELEKIVIGDLRRLDPGEMDQVFIATLHLRRGEDRFEIDARPSDSIALGVGLDTPIYVSEDVLVTVTKAPTLQEQIEAIEARRNALKQHIEKLVGYLKDPQVKAQTSPTAMEAYGRKLQELKSEYMALGELLRKLG